MAKKNLKTIQFVSVNDGLYSGLYLDGNLLAGWHENDAEWRGEYFDGMLEKLGYSVKYKPASKASYEMLQEDLKGHFGYTDDDGYEDENY